MCIKQNIIEENMYWLFHELLPGIAKRLRTLNARYNLLLLVLLFTIEQSVPFNAFAQIPSSPESYSRFSTDPYEVYSFAAVEEKVDKIRNEGRPIPTGHPRIFITPSKRAVLRQKIQQHYLAEMKALVAIANAAYGTTFTDKEAAAQPVILIEALIYQLGEIPGVSLAHTPEQYGKDAVKHLTSDAMINSYYKHLEYLALPLGYDWLYDLMTPAQRQLVAAQLLQTAFPEKKQILDWNNPPGARLLGAVAINGDPGVDQAKVSLALDDFYTGMVFGDPADSNMMKFSQDLNLTLNHIFNGGGPGAEGLIYSSSWRPIYPFLLAWRDQTGEDYFKLPLFQNWPLHFTHSTGNEYEHQDKFAYSANDRWRQGGTKYTGVFTYLELGLLESNRDMSALMKYHRRTYNPDPSQQLIYLLLSDPTLKMKSPKELNLPKTAHFDVVNSIFSRHSWQGIDSTWLMFQSPTWTNVRNLGPLNDLNIWKHGGMLLGKHEQFHDYDGGNRTNTLLLYDETDPGVTYIPQNVMDRAANRYLGFSFKNGASIKKVSKDLVSYHEGLRYFEDQPEKYLYAMGDGRQAFGALLSSGTAKSPPKNVYLEGWSRQLIWFRAVSNNDPDHFIVMDRVKKDRDTLKEHLRFNFGMNPQIRNRRTNQDFGMGTKEFEGKWNYTNADRIVVTNTVKTDWGTAHGRLFIDTLLPRQVNYLRMGGVVERNIDVFGNLRSNRLQVKGNPNSTDNILGGMWRVQIEPQINNLENTYLHVMQATDMNVETPDTATLIEDEDLIGAAIANNMALFSPNEIEITHSSAVLPAGISGSYRLLIADLSPDTPYSVVIGTSRLEKVASLAGTIFLENIHLESGRTISISSNDDGSPIARFTADSTSGTAPLVVGFNASSSYDADGAITSYTWDFGDGTSESGKTVSHTYTNVGAHTAKLTVRDNDGKTGSAWKIINVSPAATVPPIADFTFDIISGKAPITVNCDASISKDSDGEIVSYIWDFGDGAQGKGAEVSHIYNEIGTFTVKLTVTDDDGMSDSLVQTIVLTNAISTFPVELTGEEIPKEAMVSLRVSKPSASGGTATLTLSVFDPDIAAEGTLEINGHGPIILFDKLARPEYARKTVPIRLNTPADWWKDGVNTLRFVHTKLDGFVVKSVSVAFETAERVGDFAISNLGSETITTAKPYEIFDLKVGEFMYTEGRYRFVSVPEILTGHKSIRTGYRDRASRTSNSDFMTFDVHQDMNIYILYSNRNSTIEQDWLNDANGWKLVDYTVVTNLRGKDANRLVRKKFFRKGSIKLSGNGGPGSMYNVVIVPAASESKTSVVKMKSAISTQGPIGIHDARQGDDTVGLLNVVDPGFPGTPASWTVYENAEDGMITGWTQYNSGVVKNVHGGVGGSGRAIELIGDIKSDVFRLGQKNGSDWDNKNESFAEFSIVLEKAGSGAIYFQVETNAGLKYLVYTDSGMAASQDLDLIHVSLGDIADGQWHKFFRNLEEDLKTYDPDIQLRSVKGLFVYGSAKLDDIKLLDFAAGQIN